MDDPEKVYKFVNKLTPVKELYRHAFQMRTYNDWTRFKNKLLKEKGKKPEDIAKEFLRLYP